MYGKVRVVQPEPKDLLRGAEELLYGAGSMGDIDKLTDEMPYWQFCLWLQDYGRGVPLP